MGTVRHARKALDVRGWTCSLAQGYDAGGRRADRHAIALLPQIVDAAQGKPVLAAGGIAATPVLGCIGAGAQAWLGTLWMAARETIPLPP